MNATPVTQLSKANSKEHKALVQVPLRHGIRVSSQMSVWKSMTQAVKFIFNTDRDPTKKLLKPESYLSTVIFPFSFLETGKKGVYSRITWHSRHE